MQLFGLVFAGIIGGPVARFSIKSPKTRRKSPENDEVDDIQEVFEQPKPINGQITARSLIETNCTDFPVCLLGWSIFRCANKRYCTQFTQLSYGVYSLVLLSAIF